MEFSAFRPLRTATPLAKLVATLGLLLIAQAGMLIAFGAEPRTEPSILPSSAVTIFNGLTGYLNKRGFPSDYVLYSNYDALVAALEKGEVEIAWNTPLAHGQYHVRNQCASQTLGMRDVDCNVRSTLIVRGDSGIKSLADLAGKR